MCNPADILQLPYAGCDPDLIIAYRGDVKISNRQLQIRIAAWQRLLANLPGRTFALFMHDSVEFCGALYGAWRAGKTLFLPGDTLATTCTSLAAAVDGFIGDFDDAWSPLILAGDSDACDKRADINDIDPSGAIPALAADFEALVVYTSGSSGDAQAIPKRLSQLASEVAMLEQFFGPAIGAAEVLATVSHQHIYGLLFKILWPLAARRPLHAASAVFLEELLPQMQSRPCVLISSPAHLKRFPERPAAAALAPLQLRAVFSSGGPLTPQAAVAAGALLGCMPIEIYGSSETGGIAWRQRAATAKQNGQHNSDCGDSWSALPGVQWQIDAADETLLIRSPHLPDSQWQRMADRARIAHAAPSVAPSVNVPRFILQGRSDRIVKLEEKRISLDAIERALCASPLVDTAKVLLHEPAQQRAGTVAFLVPSDHGRSTLARIGKAAFSRQLKATLARSVAAIALPRNWRYLDALPVNAQGKTPQAQLLALLAPASDHSPDAVKTVSPRPTLPHAVLQHRDSEQVVLTLHIVDALLYFDGHFIDTPILPGVVQLDWAIDFGHRYFDLPPVFKSVKNLKFQQVIHPDMDVTLELTQVAKQASTQAPRHPPEQASLRFRVHSQAGQHASGLIIFAANEETDKEMQDV